MGHANGLCSLCLARVNGKDSASDCLSHVSACIDGKNEIGGAPHGHIDPQHGQKPVVNKHGLGHHGRSAEKLHIGVQNQFHDPEHGPLYRVVPPLTWYGLDNTHGKAYDTAHQGTYQGNLKADACALEHRHTVSVEYDHNTAEKICWHIPSPYSFTYFSLMAA